MLDNININYAPNGFSAYEVPEETFPSLGRTGMPVAIQLTLAFKEVSYLTKDDFDVGKTKGIVKNIEDPSNQERDS